MDLEATKYPDDWTESVDEIPVSLKTILKTCDANMHTALTVALLGTKVVNVEDVGTHRDSAMVASWVGNTTREDNFLSFQRRATVSMHVLAIKGKAPTHTAKVVPCDIYSPLGR
jgi:hypothetical protein